MTRRLEGCLDLRDCKDVDAVVCKTRTFLEQIYDDMERRFATDVTADEHVDPDDAVEMIAAMRAEREANIAEALRRVREMARRLGEERS